MGGWRQKERRNWHVGQSGWLEDRKREGIGMWDRAAGWKTEREKELACGTERMAGRQKERRNWHVGQSGWLEDRKREGIGMWDRAAGWKTEREAETEGRLRGGSCDRESGRGCH
jgi:hypothetical protein